MLHENHNGRPLGRYRLIAFLDQREFGTTHLAVTKGARPKLVVIKELRHDLVQNRRFVETFLTEARLAATLKHRNVIRTLEAGRDGDRLFLSMEFLDGQPLSKILLRDERAPRLSLSARIQILCAALAGLEHAHGLCDYDGVGLGVVHRDISPQNLFVTYDGEVKVTDFGIARAAEADGSPRPGGFKGKLAYLSPEQVTGQPADRRTDVFAIGVMLWEAIAMRRLAPGAPTRAAIEKRALGREPRIADLVPDVEPLLAEICDRAMHVDPQSRYASARELRQALLTFLFVSGESATPAEIGQVVRAKFAEERTEMHQLVRDNVKEDELPESMRHSARQPQADDDGPTRIADLSRYAETSEVAAKAPAEDRVDRAVTTIEPVMASEPVTTEPVTIEPVMTEPLASEPPSSRVGAYVPPPTTWSSGRRARNRLRIWTTGAAVALSASAYLALHARPHAASVPSVPAGISRTTTAAEPASLPPPPTEPVPSTAVSNATPPVLEISELPADVRERPGSAGKLRLRRVTSARVAPLRERPLPRPDRPSAPASPPSPPPVARVSEVDRTPAAREKPPEVPMGQDLRLQPARDPRTIDQDNPFR
jgi:serine/threonine protein kinase